MDQLRAMRLFVAVAEAGSLSAAAKRLGEPLTSTSRRLAELETHLGCRLIERTTRRMSLTAVGADYLATCKSVLDALAAAEERIAGQAVEPAGLVAITAPVQFGRWYVLPVLVEFLTLNPRIRARLTLLDRVVGLIDEEIDVAVRIGQLPDSTLIATRVGTLRFVTCAAPDYLARHGTPATPQELSGHDCLSFAGLPGAPRWVFQSRRHGRRTVRIAARLSVNTADAAVAAAVAGLGVVRVLSYQARAAIADGSLATILDRFDDGEVPIHLVYRSGRSDAPHVRAWIDFAARRLRAATTSP